MNRIIMALFLLTAIVSCHKKSSKLEPEQIYQKLELSYDANENRTTFYAYFTKKRENGKIVKLDGNSSVTVNGGQMEFLGVGYSLTFDGLIDTGIFVYTDNNGKMYSNTVTAVSEISNGFQYYIYKSSPTNTWNFYGDPTNSGEEVSIHLINQANLSSNSISTSNEVGANYITITKSDIAELALGTADATTIRTYSRETGDFTGAGGMLVSKYKSFISTVSVEQ